MSGCVPKHDVSFPETDRSRRTATIRVPNRRSGDRCAPRRSRRANIHLGSGSTNVPNRRSGNCCAPRDRVGLTYTKWWRHSRACSDMCNGRAPAPTRQSRRPAPATKRTLSAWNTHRVSSGERATSSRASPKDTRYVFLKQKPRSLLLFRRVRFVRAPDPPHYK